MPDTKYVSRLQWAEYLQEVWDPNAPHHYDADTIVEYVDVVLAEGDEEAKKRFPDLSAHVESCLYCGRDVNNLITVVENAGGG